MSGLTCNYQHKVTEQEISEALTEGVCHICGLPEKELRLVGQHLEVCGEEFASDIASCERFLTPVALCPACHRNHHLDASQNHNPCQIEARLSREGLL